MTSSETLNLCLAAVIALTLSIEAAAQPVAADDPPELPTAAELERAREIREKRQRGDALTDGERRFIRDIQQRRRALRQRQRTTPEDQPMTPGDTSDLVPITQFEPDQRYKDMPGGLYPGGRNDPPEAHLAQAMQQARQIRPLDAAGLPDDDGRVVLLSLGMSNTTQAFARFIELADADAGLSSHLLLVDGAQGGQDASAWADPENRRRQDRPETWQEMHRRLDAASASPRQVQAVWIKQARPRPQALGDFPAHAEALADDLTAIVNRLRDQFPNLRIVYLSSRTYAGYATSPLNPEPYAYESAFAVRWLIERQIDGDPTLNHDPERGPVNSPILLWGPYLWAAGEQPNPDGLFYTRDDFADDGTHPSPAGRHKVALQLLQFFKSQPTATPWTLRPD